MMGWSEGVGVRARITLMGIREWEEGEGGGGLQERG